jgi:hypothetical protein
VVTWLAQHRTHPELGYRDFPGLLALCHAKDPAEEDVDQVKSPLTIETRSLIERLLSGDGSETSKGSNASLCKAFHSEPERTLSAAKSSTERRRPAANF